MATTRHSNGHHLSLMNYYSEPAINDVGCRGECGGDGRRKATAPIAADNLDQWMMAEPCDNPVLGLVREEIKHAMGR